MSDDYDGDGGGDETSSHLPHRYPDNPQELRQMLQVQDEEITKLRQLVNGTAGSVETKYLEALRKCKDLKVKLDVQRSRSQKLSVQIAELERMLHDATSAMLPRGSASVDEDLARELKEKAEKSARSATELRRTVEDQKKELNKMRRVLQREIGEDVDIERICNDPESTWKGRAQQITLLKSKLKELEKRIMEGSVSGGLDPEISSAISKASVTTMGTRKDHNDAYRAGIEDKEAKRRNETRDLQVALKSKEEEVVQVNRKVEAAQARHLILERENTTLRSSLARILEKTENDDKLIAAYKIETQNIREEMKGLKRGGAVELPRSNDPHDVLTLQKKLQKLQCEVIEGQKQLLSVVSQQQRGLGDVGSASSKSLSLNAARIEIEHLRRLVTALQDRLIESVTFVPFDATTIHEGMPTAQIVEKCTLLKGENASLRERLTLLQDISQREVSVYKAIADNLRREMEEE